MSTSTALLEEKYRRAVDFGKYLDSHPDSDDPLHQELKRQTSYYRIAIINILESRVDRGK